MTPNFFATVKASGLKVGKLWGSLQTAPSKKYGFRTGLQAYRVKKDISISTAEVANNPHLSSGGGKQYFIRDFKSVLEPIREFKLSY